MTQRERNGTKDTQLQGEERLRCVTLEKANWLLLPWQWSWLGNYVAMTRVSLVMQNWPHPPTSFTSCEEQGGCGTGEVSAPGIGALCVSVCVMQSHYGHLSSAAREQDGSLNLKDNILIWEHFNVQVRVRSSLQEMNTKEPEEAEREFVIFAFGHSLFFFFLAANFSFFGIVLHPHLSSVGFTDSCPF